MLLRHTVVRLKKDHKGRDVELPVERDSEGPQTLVPVAESLLVVDIEEEQTPLPGHPCLFRGRGPGVRLGDWGTGGHRGVRGGRRSRVSEGVTVPVHF